MRILAENCHISVGVLPKIAMDSLANPVIRGAQNFECMTPMMQQSFHEKGFAIFKNVIPYSLIDSLGATLLNLCKKFSSNEFNAFDSNKILENLEFHNRLIKLRAENPKAGGAIYDSLQCSVSIAQVSLYPKLLDLIAALLNETTSNLNNYIHLLRIDTPRDTRNSLGWHHDSVTTEKKVTCHEGIVAWIPLHAVGPKLGSIDLCIGSHNEGANNIVRAREGTNASEYLEYPQDIVDKYKQFTVEAECGDVVLMKFHTIHRSGLNSSDRIRFTLISRYYSMMAKDFSPGRNKYVLSNWETT
jgi:hypothetical protein